MSAKHLFLLTPLLALSQLAFAQYEVTGSVMSETSGETCPNAVYRIYEQTDTLRPVTSNITDVDGVLMQPLASPGEYLMKVEFLGDKTPWIPFSVSTTHPKADLGIIYIHQQGEMLQEVVVKASKPVVQSDGATLTYNSAEDPAVQSSNVLDMMRHVPMVSVDAQDNIQVKGKSDFKIYLNGKPNPMLQGDNLKTVLKAMPASSVKKVEVITEPGSKYDAEGTGGIINIVTMSNNNNLDGYLVKLNGSLSTNGSGGGVYYRGKKDKVMGSLNVNAIDQQLFYSPNESTSTTIYKNEPENYRLVSEGKVHQPASFVNVGGDLSWEPDSLNLFTLSGNYTYVTLGKFKYNNSSQMFRPDGSLVFSNNRLMNGNLKINNFSVSTSYQHTFKREGHNLILSYMYAHNATPHTFNYEYTDCVNFTPPSQAERDYSKSLENSHIAQIDYTNPLGNNKHLLEFGAKGVWRDNNSFSTYSFGNSFDDLVLNDAMTTDLTQYQDIMALYGAYTGHYGKWNTKAGLRYEYTHMGVRFHKGDYKDFGTNLHDVVPNAAISYSFGPVSNLRLAYQMRISRPGIDKVNPAPVIIDFNDVRLGNPDLGSEHSNNISLTYTNFSGRVGGTASISYARDDNMISDYAYAKDGVTYTTYSNFGHYQGWNIDGYIQWNIIPGMQASLSVGVNHDAYFNEKPAINRKGWGAHFWASWNYRLPCKLRLTAYGGGGTNHIQLQGNATGWNGYGLSIARSFLKNDALEVVLNADNFIQPYFTYSNHVESDNMTMDSKWRFKTWKIGISVSFTLGGLKSDVKKTAAVLESNDVSKGGAGIGGGGSQGGGH